MKFEIGVELVDSKNLMVWDRTKWLNRMFDAKVYSFKLDIVSANIAGDGIYDIDLMDYINLHRTDYELFRITTETLGLGVDNDIPDGIYYLKFKVNNETVRTTEVLVIEEVRKELVSLAEVFSPTADLTINDIVINTNVNNNLIYKWYYTVGLYFQLVQATSKPGNYKTANDILDKLQRALTILKTKI